MVEPDASRELADGQFIHFVSCLYVVLYSALRWTVRYGTGNKSGTTPGGMYIIC